MWCRRRCLVDGSSGRLLWPPLVRLSFFIVLQWLRPPSFPCRRKMVVLLFGQWERAAACSDERQLYPRWTCCRPGVVLVDRRSVICMPASYGCCCFMLYVYLLIVLLTHRLLLFFAHEVNETCIEVGGATVGLERRLHVFNLF